MILVDTSVWVEHFRRGDSVLARRLTDGGVLVHPWVIGELALGQWRERITILAQLAALPQAVQAKDEDIVLFIARHALVGVGIGYVDAGLLASTILTAGSRIWTHDKRLGAAAARLGVAADMTH